MKTSVITIVAGNSHFVRLKCRTKDKLMSDKNTKATKLKPELSKAQTNSRWYWIHTDEFSYLVEDEFLPEYPISSSPDFVYVNEHAPRIRNTAKQTGIAKILGLDSLQKATLKVSVDAYIYLRSHPIKDLVLSTALEIHCDRHMVHVASCTPSIGLLKRNTLVTYDILPPEPYYSIPQLALWDGFVALLPFAGVFGICGLSIPYAKLIAQTRSLVYLYFGACSSEDQFRLAYDISRYHPVCLYMDVEDASILQAHLDRLADSRVLVLTHGNTFTIPLIRVDGMALDQHLDYAQSQCLYDGAASALHWYLDHSDAVLTKPPRLEFSLPGYEDVKHALCQVIEWPHRHAERLSLLGVAAPAGLLLHGPPGNGKTTLVRAVAASCGMPFYSYSASDIYSCYVGDSEKTIRGIFDMARQSAPCVLFFDELDALVGKRTVGDGGTASGGSLSLRDAVQERILSTFLNEMDGIETHHVRVTVIGATNRIDSIDDALLRPGRLDRKVHMGNPDQATRRAIIAAMFAAIPHDEAVIPALADMTDQAYTTAKCRQLVTETVMACIRSQHGRVGTAHIHAKPAFIAL